MNKVISFLSEVRSELTKVTWPTRKETTRLTLVLLTLAAAVGLYVGALDYLFTKLLEFIVSH